MSVYFEKRLTTNFGDISSDVLWFEGKKVAVAFKNQSEGNYICIYDDHGDVLKKMHASPAHENIGCMSWSPRGLLVAAWGASLFTSTEDDGDLAVVESPHRSPLCILFHSPQGSRLISADVSGGLVGWTYSGRQILTTFHHELSAIVTHGVFRDPLNKGIDLRGAAKAAVAGDEYALDLFSNGNIFGWRPKTAGRRLENYSSGYQDNLDFYIAANTGIILYVTETGRCEEVLDLGCACCQLLYSRDKDQLLILTEYLAIIQISIEQGGGLKEMMRVKLSGDTRELQPSMVWAGQSTVAVGLGGASIRLWDLDNGDNTVLAIPASASASEHFTELACSPSHIVCGGTNAGNLFLWNREGNDWQISGKTFVSTPVKQLAWGNDVLVVSTLSNVYQLTQHPLSASFSQQFGCVQTSGCSVLIIMTSVNPYLQQEITCDLQIRGLAISNKYCVLFSDKTVVVNSLLLENKDEINTQPAGKFDCECEGSALHDESLVILEPQRVTIRTVQGTVKQMLFFVPTEGAPIIYGVQNYFVSVATSEGFVRLWDMSRREARSHGKLKNLHHLIDSYGEVMKLSCNSDGSKLALTVANADMIPTNMLYIADVESDNVQWLDVGSGINKEGIAYDEINNLLISSFAWDENEPMLLVVYCKTRDKTSQNLLCLWSTQENGILLHENIQLKKHCTQLLNCSAPNITFLTSQTAPPIESVTMGDFQGVDDPTPASKKAILNFSYNLAIGNMDLAFKAINSINSENVWMNLARKCVRTKRLDVALVCMGRTGNARIAAAMRKAEREPELDARVGVLALNLGMLDEAKILFRGCGRFDLLNKLHQSLSQWDEAIKISEEADRVHLRATHHLHGKWLEQSGLIDAALKAYEQADTHRLHAPRLLVDDPDRLKSCVDGSGDLSLLKWFAQYLESVGDMQTALQYYTRAGDLCSCVRVLCFLGDLSKASEVVLSSGDKAAAYHLARQLEAIDKMEEALMFFTNAGAYGNAIRICKEQGLTEKVWSLAMRGSTRDQVDAAQFLMTAGDIHRAIILYHKAGHPQKALELALQSGNYDALDSVASGLEKQLDSTALQKLADALLARQQYSRVVDVLCAAGKQMEAINLCCEYSVQMTEELAEKLSANGPQRTQILLQIAQCALSQSNYQLAAKKFTQAGDKVQAMKALLKSGDTDKIIFLAGVSREKEVYVMAANYLQALDWRSDPQLLNTVIQFYTKAKAHSALANFYMACANVEVEEYNDLDKAIAALSEARRSLSRMPDDGQSRRALETLDRRVSAVQQLNKAQVSFESGKIPEGMNICRQILPVCDPDGPITRAKVLAVMIKNETDRTNARHIFEELKTCVGDPGRLVPFEILASFGLVSMPTSAEDTIE